MRYARVIPFILVGSAVTIASCGDEGGGSTFVVVDGGADGTTADVENPPEITDGSAVDSPTGAIPCDEQCPSGLQCNHGFCLPPQSKCTKSAECNYDSYCDPGGQCVPYGSKPEGKTSDPTCSLVAVPGVLAPRIKCEFAIPAGDKFPNHIDVQATPMVARLSGASAPPSIVAPFTAPVANSYTENLGVVRVLKGTDCSLEANLGGVDIDGDSTVDWVRSSSPVAVGDLDGDGVPEIVVYMADGTTVAFTHKAGTWAPLWPKKKATKVDGTTLFVASPVSPWAGPSIHDLDDDGKPEVIREGWVIDGLTGKLRNDALPPSYVTHSVGLPAVLANLDADPKIELTNGANIWEFDGATNTWTRDATYGAVSSTSGWAGVADLNPYDGKKQPEIVVTTTVGNPAVYRLQVFDLSHQVFMGMDLAIPGDGGGPPTIADYDGDGLPEIGVASRDFYVVFDPDCQATPRTGGKCNSGTTNRILWQIATQDRSSRITGSSVFDFEADGKAEVVYADECFARVYDGTTGKVLFSQYRSSCTWLENPVVADVDGDFRAELVVPSNTACGPVGVGISCQNSLDSNGVDAQFAGLQCKTNADCTSGLCDTGYCRCARSAHCCALADDAKCVDFGYKCAPPPAGTPGSGATCRATRPKAVQGIRVYEDGNDRWVRSRAIWSQHAYAVTHINEDGTVPKASAWAGNWTNPTLNNFRQNVPGTADGKAIGDLTAQAGPFFTCAGGAANMTVPVCNRGTAPVGAGIAIGFYVAGAQVCTATTAGPLDVGKCENVACSWSAPPGVAAKAVDVDVVVNDGQKTQECNTTNDKGLVKGVFCDGPR